MDIRTDLDHEPVWDINSKTYFYLYTIRDFDYYGHTNPDGSCDLYIRSNVHAYTIGDTHKGGN